VKQRVEIGIALAVAAVLGGSVVGFQASAQADPLGVVEGEVLDVSAQRLDVDIQQGTALLEGAVTAKLGELVVECPKVEVRYDGSPRVRWAKGSGGVTARLKGVEATASVIEVDVPRRSVSLAGSVRLARGRGWVKAERATIDIATGKVTLETVKGEIPVESPRR
jgi:lipopolysaccharide export system protein LptA